MKIIDINMMVGPQPAPARYEDAQGLIRIMDDYRITIGVVCHSAAQMTPWQYNAEMTRISQESDGRIQACHLLDPMLGEKSEPGEGTLIERLKANRPSAVRMMPQTQNYPLDSFFCGEILEVINELRLPLLLDSSEAPNFKDMPKLAQDFPDIPIVILRKYFRSSRSLTPLLTKLSNVYIDVNIIIDTGYLEELVNERCGSEKLLLGSGLPLHVPAGGLSMVHYSTMDEYDKENILFRNWERLQREVRYENS